MASKSNQHYVPQFYFRYFSENGKSISVLRRDCGKTIKSAPIKGQASKRYFYGDAEIEDNLSKIEGVLSLVLHQIKAAKSFNTCTLENHLLLLQNIMLQKSRTMSARKKSKAMQDRLLQLFMECEVNNDESLDEETKIDFRRIAQGLEANPKQYQNREMSIAVECSEGLQDLTPIILNNRTNRPFIFGDAPVVFVNPHLKQIKLRGVLGAQTPGLIVLYPVGVKHSIMLVDENAYKVNRLRNSVVQVRNYRDIMLLNKLQIHNASSAVYYSKHQHTDYVFELWRQERKQLVDHKGKVVEAPGINHEGEPIGDILHSFEEQLSLVPKFSFLEYQEISEEDYKFGYRNKCA